MEKNKKNEFLKICLLLFIGVLSISLVFGQEQVGEVGGTIIVVGDGSSGGNNNNGGDNNNGGSNDGGSSSGGSSGGGGGSSGGGSSGFGNSFSLLGSDCVEEWECTEWENCIDGERTRFCEDKNNCGTYGFIPKGIKECIEVELEEISAPLDDSDSRILGALVGSDGKPTLFGLVGLIAVLIAGYFVVGIIRKKKFNGL
jgi:hypothetical protein